MKSRQRLRERDAVSGAVVPREAGARCAWQGEASAVGLSGPVASIVRQDR